MPGEPEDADGGAIDGRLLRSKRTRQALIDALISLIEEGDLRPTAPRIADRAKVSLRSIYHHFDDLELLFAETSARELEKVIPLRRPLPGSGPLEARVDALVAQRICIWEAVTPIRSAAALQEPFSPQLRTVRSEIHGRSRAELASVFATELAGAADPDVMLDVLDAAVNWAAWRVMRTDMALSVDAAAAVLRHMVLCLAGEGAGAAGSVSRAEGGSVPEGVDGAVAPEEPVAGAGAGGLHGDDRGAEGTAPG